ncbi:MAG TPA: lectin-like protein [Kofleriaceae bacterium]|jgi:hypothetical protein|nr:lectin-like protein [Kofleriaceae bacterium]
MRVLILLAVVVAGCYDPAVHDCQFTCPDNTCPDNLTCMAGVCRTPGASGACPCPDPPSGCSLASNSAGLCLAACSTSTDWNAANTACGAAPPWHIAVLDAPGTLSAGESALPAATTWIGLTRSGSLVDWEWRTGGGTIGSTSPDWTTDRSHDGTTITNLCAAVDHGKLYSDECDVSHAYACTTN